MSPRLQAPPHAMTTRRDPVIATPMGVVRHYWGVVGGRWWQIAIPVGLITLANALEGLSLALIIPLTKAFADNSFAFMDESWALSWMPNTVPDSITDPALRDAWVLGLVFGLLILGRVGKVVFEYASTLYSVERLERIFYWNKDFLLNIPWRRAGIGFGDEDGSVVPVGFHLESDPKEGNVESAEQNPDHQEIGRDAVPCKPGNHGYFAASFFPFE